MSLCPALLALIEARRAARLEGEHAPNCARIPAEQYDEIQRWWKDVAGGEHAADMLYGLWLHRDTTGKPLRVYLDEAKAVGPL